MKRTISLMLVLCLMIQFAAPVFANPVDDIQDAFGILNNQWGNICVTSQGAPNKIYHALVDPGVASSYTIMIDPYALADIAGYELTIDGSVLYFNSDNYWVSVDSESKDAHIYISVADKPDQLFPIYKEPFHLSELGYYETPKGTHELCLPLEKMLYLLLCTFEYLPDGAIWVHKTTDHLWNVFANIQSVIDHMPTNADLVGKQPGEALKKSFMYAMLSTSEEFTPAFLATCGNSFLKKECQNSMILMSSPASGLVSDELTSDQELVYWTDRFREDMEQSMTLFFDAMDLLTIDIPNQNSKSEVLASLMPSLKPEELQGLAELGWDYVEAGVYAQETMTWGEDYLSQLSFLKHLNERLCARNPDLSYDQKQDLKNIEKSAAKIQDSIGDSFLDKLGSAIKADFSYFLSKAKGLLLPNSDFAKKVLKFSYDTVIAIGGQPFQDALKAGDNASLALQDVIISSYATSDLLYQANSVPYDNSPIFNSELLPVDYLSAQFFFLYTALTTVLNAGAHGWAHIAIVRHLEHDTAGSQAAIENMQFLEAFQLQVVGTKSSMDSLLLISDFDNLYCEYAPTRRVRLPRECVSFPSAAPLGNVVTMGTDVYYWQYNERSFLSDSTGTNDMFSPNPKGEDMLMCRHQDGKTEEVLRIPSFGCDNPMGVIGNNLYFSFRKDEESSPDLMRYDPAAGRSVQIGTGKLVWVDSEKKRLVVSHDNMLQIINPARPGSPVSIRGSYLGAKDHTIYYQPPAENESDSQAGVVTLSACNVVTGWSKTICTTEPIAGYDTDNLGTSICRLILSRRRIYFSYGALDDTGAMFQGGNICSVSYSGANLQVVAKTDQPGFHLVNGTVALDGPADHAGIHDSSRGFTESKGTIYHIDPTNGAAIPLFTPHDFESMNLKDPSRDGTSSLSICWAELSDIENAWGLFFINNIDDDADPSRTLTGMVMLHKNLITGDLEEVYKWKVNPASSNCANAIKVFDDLYYFKYPVQNFEKSSSYYNGTFPLLYNIQVPLICRHSDGEEEVLLNVSPIGRNNAQDNPLGYMADMLYYNTSASDGESMDLMRYDLATREKEHVGTGYLKYVDPANGIVVTNDSDTIHIINVDHVDDFVSVDGNFLCAKDSMVFYEIPNTPDVVSLGVANTVTGESKTLCTTDPGKHTMEPFVCKTVMTDDRLYFSSGSLSGTGYIFAGGNICSVNYDGTDFVEETTTTTPCFTVIDGEIGYDCPETNYFYDEDRKYIQNNDAIYGMDPATGCGIPIFTSDALASMGLSPSKRNKVSTGWIELSDDQKHAWGMFFYSSCDDFISMRPMNDLVSTTMLYKDMTTGEISVVYQSTK